MTDELEPLAPSEGIQSFLAHREPSVRKSTLQNARHRLGVFREWCESEDIDNLNELDGRLLSDFVASRRGEIAPITLQKQLTSVRQFLRWAADIEAVTDGLAEKVHAPELPDGAEARDEHLPADRAEDILDYLGTHHYASRDHALFALMWRTGMRRSAVRSLDVSDLRPDEHAVRVEHRPETGTKLKNGEDGERWVFLGPRWYSILDDYLDNPDRYEVTDDEGRTPLFTSKYGRPTGDTIYKWTHRLTRPCVVGGCPHDDKDPSTCPAASGNDGAARLCPSSRGPHDVRRGAITAHLNDEVPPEAVSGRCDVSLSVLYRHYDVRTDREKMEVRKQQLNQ
ncbi:tyrosine-type recombinase/integrase [Halorientalis litorea]|uniref:tyrosine-type recombinase/integrase n=1 Tax=Halorientalis litorea TaxID=2931977 RepID=UPI001FF41F8E|nr:tyrosine-type recombinase/integrase [Halorientalis litorea]